MQPGMQQNMQRWAQTNPQQYHAYMQRMQYQSPQMGYGMNPMMYQQQQQQQQMMMMMMQRQQQQWAQGRGVPQGNQAQLQQQQHQRMMQMRTMQGMMGMPQMNMNMNMNMSPDQLKKKIAEMDRKMAEMQKQMMAVYKKQSGGVVIQPGGTPRRAKSGETATAGTSTGTSAKQIDQAQENPQQHDKKQHDSVESGESGFFADISTHLESKFGLTKKPKTPPPEEGKKSEEEQQEGVESFDDGLGQGGTPSGQQQHGGQGLMGPGAAMAVGGGGGGMMMMNNLNPQQQQQAWRWQQQQQQRQPQQYHQAQGNMPVRVPSPAKPTDAFAVMGTSSIPGFQSESTATRAQPLTSAAAGAITGTTTTQPSASTGANDTAGDDDEWGDFGDFEGGDTQKQKAETGAPTGESEQRESDWGNDWDNHDDDDDNNENDKSGEKIDGNAQASSGTLATNTGLGFGNKMPADKADAKEHTDDGLQIFNKTPTMPDIPDEMLAIMGFGDGGQEAPGAAGGHFDASFADGGGVTGGDSSLMMQGDNTASMGSTTGEGGGTAAQTKPAATSEGDFEANFDDDGDASGGGNGFKAGAGRGGAEDANWDTFSDEGNGDPGQQTTSMQNSDKAEVKASPNDGPVPTAGGVGGFFDMLGGGGAGAAAAHDAEARAMPSIFFGEPEVKIPKTKVLVDEFFGGIPQKKEPEAKAEVSGPATNDDDEFEAEWGDGADMDGSGGEIKGQQEEDKEEWAEWGDDAGDGADGAKSSEGHVDAKEKGESVIAKEASSHFDSGPPENTNGLLETKAADHGAEGEEDWGEFPEHDDEKDAETMQRDTSGKNAGDEFEANFEEEEWGDSSNGNIITDANSGAEKARAKASMGQQSDPNNSGQEEFEEEKKGGGGVDLGIFGGDFIEKFGGNVGGEKIRFKAETTSSVSNVDKSSSHVGSESPEVVSSSNLEGDMDKHKQEDEDEDNQEMAQEAEADETEGPRKIMTGLFDDLYGKEDASTDIKAPEMFNTVSLDQRLKRLEEEEAEEKAKQAEDMKGSGALRGDPVGLESIEGDGRPYFDAPVGIGGGAADRKATIDDLFFGGGNSFDASRPSKSRNQSTAESEQGDIEGDEQDEPDLKLAEIPREGTADTAEDALPMLIRQQRLREALSVAKLIEKKLEVRKLKRQAKMEITEADSDDEEAFNRAKAIRKKAKDIEKTIASSLLPEWKLPYRTHRQYALSNQDRYEDLSAYAEAAGKGSEFEMAFPSKPDAGDGKDTKKLAEALEAMEAMRAFLQDAGGLLRPNVAPPTENWGLTVDFGLNTLRDCSKFTNSLQKALEALKNLADADIRKPEMLKAVKPGETYVKGVTEIARVMVRLQTASSIYTLPKRSTAKVRRAGKGVNEGWKEIAACVSSIKAMGFFNEVNAECSLNAEAIRSRILDGAECCHFCCLPIDESAKLADANVPLHEVRICTKDKGLYHLTCRNLETRCCL